MFADLPANSMLGIMGKHQNKKVRDFSAAKSGWCYLNHYKSDSRVYHS